MSTKEELHQLVDRLNDSTAEEALDYLTWLASDEDSVSDADLSRVLAGEEQLARGDWVSLTDLRREIEQ